MRPKDPSATVPPMPQSRHHPAALILLLLALATPAWAQPATWTLDPVHTRVLVAVDHAGFSSALGTVSGASGTLQFEPGDWTGARVEVEIPLQRLDFGDAAWNRATLARGLLHADAHPVARFSSTRVEPIDDRHARVFGTLRLRGVEREVVLEVRLNAARRHPLPPFRRTVGFSASAVLSRSEFGVDAWRSMIGDRVELRIEAEATRSRTAARGAAPADAAPTDIDEAPPVAAGAAARSASEPDSDAGSELMDALRAAADAEADIATDAAQDGQDGDDDPIPPPPPAEPEPLP